MNRPLIAPEPTVWARGVLAARYPDLEHQAHGIGPVFAVLAVSRLAADLALAQRGVETIALVTEEQARAGLVLIADAERAPRYAELLIAHQAHALGLNWENITGMRGKGSRASYGKRLERIRADLGIPTYELPTPPVLGAYRRHAEALLETTLSGRSVNPYQRAGATDLLTVLLFLRVQAHQPAHQMREWVADDELSPALHRLALLPTDQAGPARELVDAHTAADAGFRESVAALVTPALVRLQFQQEDQEENIVRCTECQGQIEPPDGALTDCPNCGEPDPTPALRERLTSEQSEQEYTP